MKLIDIVRFRFFDESKDVGDGPMWAKILFVICMAMVYVSVTIFFVAHVIGGARDPLPALAVIVVATAVHSGAAFHLRMPGAAWNGLILAGVWVGIMLLFADVTR